MAGAARNFADEGEPVLGPEIPRLRIHGKPLDGPTGAACHCSNPSSANLEPAIIILLINYAKQYSLFNNFAKQEERGND